MKQIANLLKEHKLKATPQRLAIFHVLYNTTAHPSAETIYKSLQDTHPTMSLATVYKTLDLLKRTNLAQELNVGEDSFRYDANTSAHPHIICNSCEKVFDLKSEFLKDIRSNVKSETDFIIENEQLYFYGVCPKCQLQ